MNNTYRHFFKTALDIVLSLGGLIILSPLFVALVLALAVAHSGRVFFVQPRPGKDGRIFRLIKFRTMNRQTDSAGNLLPDMQRLTTIGKFLRRTSLDELPQLLNVLKGDMSLVGPRPLLVEYLPLYSAGQRRRHHVRPGITGWAQINGRNAISWQQKFDCDIHYVDHLSFRLDMQILWATLRQLFRPKGINASASVSMPKFTGNDPVAASGSRPQIWLSSPHMGGMELTFVQQAFADNWIAPLGPCVDGFEQDLAAFLGNGGNEGNNSHVAALNTGTSALHLALILLNVQRDDIVICQSMTFSASANPVVYLGATPVFVDSEKDTWNISPPLLQQAIDDCIRKRRKPKAIIAVDLYGMPARWDEITAIAQRYDIPIVEDAAEALGATFRERKCGVFGAFGILSFNGNKIITTSGGGALVCRTAGDAAAARFLATQARDEAPHYQHSRIGYNYRMSNIAAAIGRGQMLVLNDRLAARQRNFDFYKHALAGIPGIALPESPDRSFRSNHWLSRILVDPALTPGSVDRETIRRQLRQAGIESRPVWKPMHLQPIFQTAPFYGDGTSEHLFNHGLCLPSGSNLTQEALEEIRDNLYHLFNK
jgi:dTDP-4-amino-4,6-dideoxygalactose transaminase/lipopolysaccharide/colanic/teichoic acid biosynthesis glycosyltransferase